MSAEFVLVGAGVFALSTLASAVLVPTGGKVGKRLGIIDHPGPRKIHEAPIPRVGGIPVFLVFTGTVVTGYLLIDRLRLVPWAVDHFGNALALLDKAHTVEDKLLALLLGGALAFGVGLTDDILGQRFHVVLKVGGQVAAALILVAAGVRISFFPYDWLDSVVTIVWVVGITNAFNLIDNMDGLSAGVAFVASVVLLVNAWSLGEFFVSLVLLAFMGSLAGFLAYNFYPASVFLGDSGSHFIGYTLASLALLERYVPKDTSSIVPVLVPVLVLAVPIIDTTTVVFIRLRERRPIHVGDNRHLSHQLVALGFSQRSAVLFIYLATFTLGLGAVALVDATPWRSTLILVQSLCFISIILILMFGRSTVPERG